MFPVTINFTTFTQGDFYPFGYIVNLPESIGKIPYQLLQPTSNGLGGTDGTRLRSTGPTTGTADVSSHMSLAENVLISDAEGLPDGVVVNVTGYNPLTNVISFSAPTIPAYGYYTITPVLTEVVPVAISYGGIGGSLRTLLREAGQDFPYGNSQLICEDFTCAFNEAFPYPWQVRRVVKGTATASTTTVHGWSTAYPDDYCGVLKLSVTGISPGGLSDGSDRETSDAALLLTYGTGGSYNIVAGGNLRYKTRVLFSQGFTAGKQYTFRMGLKGYRAATEANFLNYYSAGFEINSDSEAGKVVAVYADRRTITRQPTSVYLAPYVFHTLEVIANKIEKKLYWKVNDTVVHEASIINWPNTVDTLCVPALSVENKTNSEANCFVDYFQCSQKVAR